MKFQLVAYESEHPDYHIHMCGAPLCDKSIAAGIFQKTEMCEGINDVSGWYKMMMEDGLICEECSQEFYHIEEDKENHDIQSYWESL